MSNSRVIDSARIRADFPLLTDSDLCYLDSAATTQKPQAVIDALSRYYQQDNANVHRAAHRLSRQATEAFEQARERVQRFINAAHSSEIIWTRGTTEGINLVAHSFGQLAIAAGDEILISELEHHANIVPWQLLAQRSGAKLRVIPIRDDGDLDLEAFEALLNPRTRLLALTQVSNALGSVNPIETMIEQAHRVGAKVLIDGAQAVSHFPIDVQALDCDFYLFSGHKLYGPTGIGVLYGKQALLSVMPPWQGGGEMIERVSFEASSFQPPPFRFEAGTPNIAGAIGLATAIDYLESFDRRQRLRHEQQLLNYAEQQLKLVPGLQILCNPGQRIGLIPFVIEGLHNFDLGALLDQQDIAIRTGHHCAMPLHQRLGLDGSARASFGLYTTKQDIDRLVQSLLNLLAPETSSDDCDSTSPQRPTAASPLPDTQPLLDALLSKSHWKARYALLMKAAQQRAEDPELRQPQNLLHGCSSRVWLQHHYDTKTGTLHFNIDSDARIIKGLGMLLMEKLEQCPTTEINPQTLQQSIAQLQLEKHLSPSRSNGLQAIIDEIVAIAARYR
ncbi:SufS family cysteine desulfurase [Motiliproteus coralliicola]|uniref:cysteine desulfurase n=1 Tax=Motiliproteus coralliicola TaxID=2283196 RepID=A0A369WS41_9GAMM|nr:SufS family cysteine desulfurase [Motiliproteus coralliicola]RDE24492.1 SufS family cysteine desulfurase [Motiliproteus coralliicola]